MSAHLYSFSPRSSQGSRQLVLPSKYKMDCVYANIIVDIQVRDLKDRLFTYRIPEELSQDTFIGAQVLVPFGPNLVGGYVVTLSDTTSNSPAQIRDIAEVLEPEPLFDREYIDFLYWIAQYYCANISDVIAAAIPSFFAPKIKRYARLTEHARTVFAQTPRQPAGDPAIYHLLSALREAKTGALSVVALRQRWRRGSRLPQSHFYRALNSLRNEGFLEIESQTSDSQAPKTQKVVIWNGVDPESERQRQVVTVLTRHGGQMPLRDLLAEAKTTSATIKRLEQDKIVSFSQAEVMRDPIKSVDAERSAVPDLTADQTKVLAPLSEHLAQTLATPAPQDVEPWLLHGVTGSGKTEIYLRLIEQTLKLERTALLLVPEISLTPQLASRLKSRFGDNVAIWHSALSDGERYDTWRRLRAGDVKVLLGARSAILANLPRLGLIVLDEEHDGSYKQSTPAPRYHARDVAIEKGRREGAMLLLGSATPDVSSFYNASKTDRLLSLPKRVKDQVMPHVTTVDMREEFGNGNRSIFSRLLESSLTNCFEAKEQAILLINRRGYASHVFCRACGYVVKCKNCSVSLVFHQRKGQPASASAQSTYINGHLACHHCGFRSGSAETCPSCQSPFIRQFGLGTQRVEEEVRKRYPDARILRLDSDVTVRRGAHEEILQQFTLGEADVLIGTQMVAKGLDIANVTLVGVLAADAAFNLPDYRSIERGFQLLTQVSGQARRGDKPGAVVMQTFSMEMPVLQWSKEHNYLAFYEEEISARQTFEYPPFSQLVRLIVSGHDPKEVELACEQLAEEMGNYLADVLDLSEAKILGPAPCLIERLREKYRFHLLIKNMAGERGRKILLEFLRSKRLVSDLNLAIDVDALDLI